MIALLEVDEVGGLVYICKHARRQRTHVLRAEPLAGKSGEELTIFQTRAGEGQTRHLNPTLDMYQMRLANTVWSLLSTLLLFHTLVFLTVPSTCANSY